MTRQLLTDDMRRRLVEAREAKGWTDAELSYATAIHPDNFVAWESGVGGRPLRIEDLQAWCEALGLTLKVEIE